RVTNTSSAKTPARSVIRGLRSEDHLFPRCIHSSPHLGTRQYARILGGWVNELGLDPVDYRTHSMRRTKATLIYRRTKNLRAVHLLLAPWKLVLHRLPFVRYSLLAWSGLHSISALNVSF